MYQVILLPHARKQLRDFVSYHNEFLIENFYDTGLVGEEIIRERYMREGMELGGALYDNIVEKLSREILGYEEIAGDSRITVTLLVQEEHSCTIESIPIYEKCILYKYFIDNFYAKTPTCHRYWRNRRIRPRSLLQASRI